MVERRRFNTETTEGRATEDTERPSGDDAGRKGDARTAVLAYQVTWYGRPISTNRDRVPSCNLPSPLMRKPAGNECSTGHEAHDPSAGSLGAPVSKQPGQVCFGRPSNEV